MMRRTHAATGFALGMALGAQHALPLLDSLLIAAVSQTAALLPDLDLKLKLKHRGVTHSLLALFLVGVLAMWFQQPLITTAVLVGYASHLVLDMLTIQGIELCYPWHRRVRLLRFRTGGRVDSLFAVASLGVSFYCLWGIVT